MADTVEYSTYRDETELPEIMRLIEMDLSEPYTIFTYRYFISNWPHLCHLVSSHVGQALRLFVRSSSPSPRLLPPTSSSMRI